MNDTQDTMVYVPIAEIHCDNEFNCRGELGPADVIDLVRDIEIHGLIQPVTVVRYTAEEVAKTGFKYKLCAGYCRTYAHKVLRKDTIKAIVHPPMSDTEAIAFNLAENVNRRGLNIMQEARALKKLMDAGLGREKVASMVGQSGGWVQLRFQLLKLPKEIQDEAASGNIKQDDIRRLYRIKSSGVENADAIIIEAAKKVKDVKTAKGRVQKMNKIEARNPDNKRLRCRSEIFDMMRHLRVNLGNGVATRALAWASGEITNQDLYDTVKELVEKRGLIYQDRAMTDALFGDR